MYKLFLCNLRPFKFSSFVLFFIFSHRSALFLLDVKTSRVELDDRGFVSEMWSNMH